MIIRTKHWVKIEKNRIIINNDDYVSNQPVCNYFYRAASPKSSTLRRSDLGNKLLGPHHNDSVSQLGTRRMNYIQLTDITTNGAKLENGK